MVQRDGGRRPDGDAEAATERSEYVPPMAQEIDTTLGPGETSAGITPVSHPAGAEDSSRWH
jgi:hypothetical protein